MDIIVYLISGWVDDISKATNLFGQVMFGPGIVLYVS